MTPSRVRSPPPLPLSTEDTPAELAPMAAGTLHLWSSWQVQKGRPALSHNVSPPRAEVGELSTFSPQAPASIAGTGRGFLWAGKIFFQSLFLLRGT